MKKFRKKYEQQKNKSYFVLIFKHFFKTKSKKEIYPRLDNISCDRFLFYFLYLVIITLYPSCRVY